MRHPLRSVALFLSLATAAPVYAQSGSSNATADSSRTAVDTTTRVQTDVVPLGAATTGLRAGVHARETPRSNEPNAVVESPHVGQDRAMMVVGVAALITGAIIGGTPGTIVMVGGAVVGLMGLYNYLQ